MSRHTSTTDTDQNTLNRHTNAIVTTLNSNIDGLEDRRSKTYEQPSNSSTSCIPTVVTASDTKYFHGLQNLVGSIQHYNPTAHVRIFNLGLRDSEIETAKTWSRVFLHWTNRKTYHLKKYAWKPLLLYECVRKLDIFLYLDAGSEVVGELTPVFNIIKLEGLILVRGQDMMGKWIHPNMYKWLNLTQFSFANVPSYSGNTQGYAQIEKALLITHRMRECALDPACINPPGAMLSNHRYDQSALSLIAVQMNITQHTEILAASKSQLVPHHAFKIWTSRHLLRQNRLGHRRVRRLRHHQNSEIKRT